MNVRTYTYTLICIYIYIRDFRSALASGRNLRRQAVQGRIRLAVSAPGPRGPGAWSDQQRLCGGESAWCPSEKERWLNRTESGSTIGSMPSFSKVFPFLLAGGSGLGFVRVASIVVLTIFKSEVQGAPAGFRVSLWAVRS